MSDIYSRNDERAARVEEWDADCIEHELFEIARAKATCGGHQWKLSIEDALVSEIPIGPGQVANCDCCNVCIRPGHRVEILLTIIGTHISAATTRCRSCARGRLHPETVRPCLLARGRANDANTAAGHSHLVLSRASVIDQTKKRQK